MAGTKEIKRRIKSVKNTKKITKAMELVAASKMKRAVSSTLASRLYAEYSWEVLTSISRNKEKIIHPLFEEREIKNILMVLITSNRGLCGAYNAQVIKKALAGIKAEDKPIHFITIGKKGDLAMRRVGQDVFASFFDLPDNPALSDVTPISNLITNEFISGRYDQVMVLYTDYVSALTQRPRMKKVLPVSETELRNFIDQLSEEKTKSNKTETDYLFEGDKNKFVGSLAEKLTRMQIYQMILESNASEQSARMMAMKNASDASGEMIEDLTLMFNKARQANITREISEISAGMASVS